MNTNLPDDNNVCELSKYNDRERSISIILMPNIDSCGIFQSKFLRDEWREADDIRKLFPKDRNGCHCNLRVVTDFFKVNRDPDQQSNERHPCINSILDSMMVRGKAVHEEERNLCESYALVCGDCDSLRPQVFANEIGVVAVENEQCHDPEDCDTLEEVIVVVVVRVLFCICPCVPCGRKYEDEDHKADAAWVLGQLIGEVGDLLFVRCCLLKCGVGSGTNATSTICGQHALRVFV